MKYEHNKTSDKTEVMKEKEYILLKWGTLKGWNFTSEKSKKLFKEYREIGASYSGMAQKDTPRQKEIICELIDCCNGRIQNDWDGTVYKDKKEAKKYVMEYNKGVKR